MAFCVKCGTQIGDEAKFCPVCGQPVGTPPVQEPNAFEKAMDTEDITASFDPEDIRKNKAMAVLAYLGFLILIPIFGAKDSRFARYHVGQAVILWAVETVLSLLSNIFGWIPFFGWSIRILCGLIGIAVAVFAIIGIVNAAGGKAKALPVVGSIKNMFSE